MPRGRRPLPWIKVWFDIIGDPKMAQLSAAEKWCWIGILLLAGQSPIRGKLMLSDDKPMSENDIYRALRVSPKDKKSVFQTIKKMIEMGSLKWNDDCLEVVHFKDRQEVFESDFIDYHKKKKEELSPDKVLKIPELTPDFLQKEGRGEKKDITSPNGEVYSPKPPDEVRELFDLWNSLGLIKHRKLTGQMMRAVKATLRDFSAADVSQAMKNYATILHDDSCFFKYRWTLRDFLARGLEKFLDLEVALSNYRRDKGDKRLPRKADFRSWKDDTRDRDTS